MILPKKVVYCLLLVLAGGNILFRYPLDVGHELGADTTFVHTLTTGLVQDGHAAWILHPLSYFGLYALSYPSAMPFKRRCFFSAGLSRWWVGSARTLLLGVFGGTTCLLC